MATPEKQPLQDTGDNNVAKSAPSAYETERIGAQTKLQADSQSNPPATSGNDNTSLNGTETQALNTVDGQTDNGTESVTEEMLKQQQAWQAVSKLISETAAPAIDKIFGGLSLFEGSDAGSAESKVQEAKKEQAKFDDATGEKAGEGGESALGSILSDIGSWAADTFDSYVTQPVKGLVNDVSNIFEADGAWDSDPNHTFVSADSLGSSVTGVNDAADDFSLANRSAAQGLREINLNGATDAGGTGLELPGDAYADGTVKIGGQQVTVMRTPGGDTFLKMGDRVIAQQKQDGSYNLALRDGTTLDFKMSQGSDGKYSLDKMERYKGDQLQQKLEDGVFYNYNYDAAGNVSRVDAAANIEGPLSQERLDKIRANLGDRGAAALRINGKDGSQRMLLQTHDSQTHSLTDIDKRLAQIWSGGQEFRLNQHDQLAIVNPDGTDQAVQAGENSDEQRNHDKLRDLTHQVGQRARGERRDVDGVGIVHNEDGSVSVNLTDPETGESQGHIDIPADNNQPIALINESGETATLRRDGGLSIEGNDGNPLADFDPNSGLSTDKIKVDADGIENLEDGRQLLGADGEFVAMGDEEWWNNEECEDCEEYATNNGISKATSTEVKTLGSLALSFAATGNPAAMPIAKALAAEAIGVGLAGLGAMMNDPLNSIPIQISLSIARNAFTDASRSERTQSYASKMGISDTTRLSEFNRIGTLSSTTFSPEEFVRDRLMAA
jgi:YD repeat-containing protein